MAPLSGPNPPALTNRFLLALSFLSVLVSHRLPGASAAGVHGVHCDSHADGACWLPVLHLQSRVVCLWPKPSGQGCHFQIRPLLRPLHGSQREVGGGKSCSCVDFLLLWFARAGVSSLCALLQDWPAVLPEQRWELFWSSQGHTRGLSVLIVLCSATSRFPIGAFCFVLGARFNCTSQNADLWQA